MTDHEKAELIFKAALVGGGASLMTGGDFIKGALIGYNIAAFNYLEGETPEDYVDEFGNIYKELPDLIVEAKVSKGFLDFKGTFNLWTNGASYSNATIDSFGKGLERYSGNSTFGRNGKLYLKTSAQRQFYGNQYVSTQRLTAIGSKITKITGNVGYGIVGLQFIFGAYQDFQNLDNYGYTDGYNSIRVLVSFGTALTGMEAGIYLGAKIGGGIGSLFGGVGAIPGSIIGATIGGLAGAYWGTKVGEEAVDWMYGM